MLRYLLNNYSINHLLNKMNDTNNIQVNPADMPSHTFSIKLWWDVCLMKCQIAQHYEDKYKNNFCNDKGITSHEFNKPNYDYRWSS